MKVHTRAALAELAIRRRPLAGSLQVLLHGLGTVFVLQVEVDHNMPDRKLDVVLLLGVNIRQGRGNVFPLPRRDTVLVGVLRWLGLIEVVDDRLAQIEYERIWLLRLGNPFPLMEFLGLEARVVIAHGLLINLVLVMKLLEVLLELLPELVPRENMLLDVRLLAVRLV